MLIILRDILLEIQKLNNLCGDKILTEAQFAEAFDDLNDFEKVLAKIKIDVNNLKNINMNEIKMIANTLIDIHVQLQNIIWQVDQTHEIVVKAIEANCKKIEYEEDKGL